MDVVLDGLGGKTSLRSFHALRPGGRLIVYGHYATLLKRHKNRRAWIEWYAATAAVALWGLPSPRRRVSAYRIQKLREGHHFPSVEVAERFPWVEAPAIRSGSARTSARSSTSSVRARSTRSLGGGPLSLMRAARTRCSSARRR